MKKICQVYAFDFLAAGDGHDEIHIGDFEQNETNDSNEEEFFQNVRSGLSTS